MDNEGERELVGYVLQWLQFQADQWIFSFSESDFREKICEILDQEMPQMDQNYELLEKCWNNSIRQLRTLGVFTETSRTGFHKLSKKKLEEVLQERELLEEQAEDKPVLSEGAAVAYEILRELPPYRGLMGPDLLEKMDERGFVSDQSSLTSRIIPELKLYGVDRLRSLGFVAICNVGGAGQWRDEYGEHLRGRPVAILADNDDAGRRHILQVARSLHGKASSIKVIEFDGLPEKGDVSDWLDAGHTVDELKAIVRSAPEWELMKESSAQTATLTDLKIEITDRGNGRLLAEIGKGKILFCQEFDCWMFYDDTRWFQDNIAAERIAKTVPDELWEAGRQLDNDGVVKWARSSCASARITAMLKMARSEPGMSIKASDLNPDPWKLNCPNGTLDLKTTELQPHRPEDFITTLCPTPFVPDAKCPRFMQFLDEVLKDPDVIAFLQRLFGYILTGVIREHILVIFFGDGRNGKGTLVETIVVVLAAAELPGCPANVNNPGHSALAGSTSFGRWWYSNSPRVTTPSASDGSGLGMVPIKDASYAISREITGPTVNYQHPPVPLPADLGRALIYFFTPLAITCEK